MMLEINERNEQPTIPIASATAESGPEKKVDNEGDLQGREVTPGETGVLGNRPASLMARLFNTLLKRAPQKTAHQRLQAKIEKPAPDAKGKAEEPEEKATISKTNIATLSETISEKVSEYRAAVQEALEEIYNTESEEQKEVPSASESVSTEENDPVVKVEAEVQKIVEKEESSVSDIRPYLISANIAGMPHQPAAWVRAGDRVRNFNVLARIIEAHRDGLKDWSITELDPHLEGAFPLVGGLSFRKGGVQIDFPVEGETPPNQPFGDVAEQLKRVLAQKQGCHDEIKKVDVYVNRVIREFAARELEKVRSDSNHSATVATHNLCNKLDTALRQYKKWKAPQSYKKAHAILAERMREAVMAHAKHLDG